LDSNNGTVLSTNFTEKLTLPAFNFENITVAVADNVSLTSPNTNGSIVSEADIISSEGVLHQVDSVLLPKYVSSDILDLVRIQQLLFFAPTDDAFLALGNDALEFYRSDKAATSNLVTGRAITPQIVSTVDMVNGTLNCRNPRMTPITTSIAQTANSTIYMVNDATVLFRDIPHPLVSGGILVSLCCCFYDDFPRILNHVEMKHKYFNSLVINKWIDDNSRKSRSNSDFFSGNIQFHTMSSSTYTSSKTSRISPKFLYVIQDQIALG
jgi:uncharacterized surface protein with fasciclin (FAS1) repeats